MLGPCSRTLTTGFFHVAHVLPELCVPIDAGEMNAPVPWNGTTTRLTDDDTWSHRRQFRHVHFLDRWLPLSCAVPYIQELPCDSDRYIHHYLLLPDGIVIHRILLR